MSELNQVKIKWILFLIILGFVPFLYVGYFIVGMMPIYALYIDTIIVATKIGFVNFETKSIVLSMNLINSIFYTTLVYFFSKWLSGKIDQLKPEKKLTIIVLIVGGLIFLSILPLYGVSGDGDINYQNLYKIYNYYLSALFD